MDVVAGNRVARGVRIEKMNGRIQRVRIAAKVAIGHGVAARCPVHIYVIGSSRFKVQLVVDRALGEKIAGRVADGCRAVKCRRPCLITVVKLNVFSGRILAAIVKRQGVAVVIVRRQVLEYVSRPSAGYPAHIGSIKTVLSAVDTIHGPIVFTVVVKAIVHTGIFIEMTIGIRVCVADRMDVEIPTCNKF